MNCNRFIISLKARTFAGSGVRNRATPPCMVFNESIFRAKRIQSALIKAIVQGVAWLQCPHRVSRLLYSYVLQGKRTVEAIMVGWVF